VEGAVIIFIHARVLSGANCTQQKRRRKLHMTQIIWVDSLTGLNLITGQLKISMKQRRSAPPQSWWSPTRHLLYLLAWQSLTSMMHFMLLGRVNLRGRWCFEVNTPGNLTFFYNAITFLNAYIIFKVIEASAVSLVAHYTHQR